MDYIFAGEGGQPVVVSLQSKSTSTYFSITAPGEDAALFIGSTSGNRFDGPLPKTDDYTIRAYQNRSAARRGQRADYSITFRIVRDGAAATPKSAAGSWPAKYDASGSIKCSAGEAKLDMMCDFRVIRKSGSAEVWVANIAKGAGQYRVLYFSNKAFTTNDGSKLASQRKDDNWWVSVNGREFYFIPDALIYGG